MSLVAVLALSTGIHSRSNTDVIVRFEGLDIGSNLLHDAHDLMPSE